ncbi:unnamed protein product [Oikopleura dioica]|uniref:Aquaporin n=1 Tax=Oikopleura dioica TaxID=34765 RepID=E4YSX2_OIKDI|nr:unnamed protein product [Oikopleura dioica]
MAIEEIARKFLKIRRKRVRQFLSELFGSFLLAVIGIAGSHQGIYGETSSVHGALCGGLGVAIGIYASLGGSGGHVNPAVTIYAVLAGRLGNGFKENLCGFLVYVSAQIIGMFLGAAVVYGVFDGQSYEHLENGDLICLYATCPTEEFQLSTGEMFFDQIVGTLILLIFIEAIIDDKNLKPNPMNPLLIGLCATAVGLAFGNHGGGAINPSRDLGPRLFASLAFGAEAFTGEEGFNSEYFFWIPLLAPMIGGALGGCSYLLFIKAHWEEREKNEKDELDIEEEFGL